MARIEVLPVAGTHHLVNPAGRELQDQLPFVKHPKNLALHLERIRTKRPALPRWGIRVQRFCDRRNLGLSVHLRPLLGNIGWATPVVRRPSAIP